ncbi:MAG: hypothetical protein JST89_11950 [Cyanobacteria bacterium SZAS-4]|nr:hypothetical protein [Cyanobacteria bacterium SZAS-4]
MTTQSDRREIESTAISSDLPTGVLAEQSVGLQVGRIPDAMRGANTADVPHIELVGQTNVPSLIDQGHEPIPTYTGWPYNMGYQPVRT